MSHLDTMSPRSPRRTRSTTSTSQKKHEEQPQQQVQQQQQQQQQKQQDQLISAIMSEVDTVINALHDHAQEIILKFISIMMERGIQYFQNLLVTIEKFGEDKNKDKENKNKEDNEDKKMHKKDAPS